MSPAFDRSRCLALSLLLSLPSVRVCLLSPLAAATAPPARRLPPRAPASGVVVVSGGQTGADRAALDAAAAAGAARAGWCPRLFWAEDGAVPERHRGALEPTREDGTAERTRRNVEQSDATLFVSLSEALAGGSALAQEHAREHGRPTFHAARAAFGGDAGNAALAAAEWAIGVASKERGLLVSLALNIAGPRESEEPGVYRWARDVIDAILPRLLAAQRERA